eukprot:1387235-Amorphochlora_amoeboformis.AAC.1
MSVTTCQEWAQFVRKVRHMAAVAFGLHFAATGWIIVAKANIKASHMYISVHKYIHSYAHLHVLCPVHMHLRDEPPFFSKTLHVPYRLFVHHKHIDGISKPYPLYIEASPIVHRKHVDRISKKCELSIESMSIVHR